MYNKSIKNRTIRILCLVILVVIIISIAVIEYLIILEGKNSDIDFSKEKINFVVVLGNSIEGEKLSEILGDRMKVAFECLKENPRLKVVVSGGQGKNEVISEAEAMKRYLVVMGINEDRILKEDKSKNTNENLKFTRNLLIEKYDKNEVDKIVIITSDFHMFRAKFLADGNGFVPYAITSKTRSNLSFKWYFREYFAVIKSYFLDK